MRTILFSLYFGLTSVMVYAAPPTRCATIGLGKSDSIFTRLHTLLDQKNYFRLKTALEKEAGQLSADNRIYFQAFVDNAFGHMETSLEAVNGLLRGNHPSLTQRQKYQLWILQGSNYYKTGQYRLARESCDSLLLRYKDQIDASGSDELINNRMLWQALEDVPPMEVKIGQHSGVRWKRDAAGLINIPVRKDTSTYDFVFDTGAGLSTISESFARQLQLRLRAVRLDVESSTGIHNTSTLAVADSLYLGDILLKNVVFLVLPDAKLSFPQIHYSIHAILGMPVICQLQEVHILRDGTFNILSSTATRPSNLAMNGWTPIVSVQTMDDTLSFYLDAGATTTDLLSPYFNKHSLLVMQSGHPEISRRGGAGGIVKTDVYHLNNFTLSVGGQQITLPHIDVSTQPANAAEGEIYDGTLGQDVMGLFPEMILNFKEMYLAFLP